MIMPVQQPYPQQDGHPIHLDHGIVVWPQLRIIKRNGIEIHLPPQLFDIFMKIAQAKFGVTVQGLFDHIYDHRADGGPETGRKAMCVQRVNLNRRIEPLHLHVKSPGQGRAGGIYELKVTP